MWNRIYLCLINCKKYLWETVLEQKVLMSHISDALCNVSFLTTLKNHQSKEAEVLASETLYVGYPLML